MLPEESSLLSWFHSYSARKEAQNGSPSTITINTTSVCSDKLMVDAATNDEEEDTGRDGGGKTRLKKQLGLLESVGILRIINGSEIFISPKGVLREAGSVGLSLVVWGLCGFLSIPIPKSGSDYAYIGEFFGGLPSFLYLWDAIFIFFPTTKAIMSLTIANYLAQPLFPDCDPPDAALSLIAAVSITGQIAFSFYSGIFSYAGWNYLNFMSEELKDPYKNLPRAIYIFLPPVTIIFMLACVSYLAVLSPAAMFSSDAIAVTFSNKMFGYLAPITPALISISTMNCLSCHIMTSSRFCFVGARNGHFSDCLSFITVNYHTPASALVFLCILSLFCLSTSNIYRLIDYTAFVESMFILVAIAGLLYLRYTRPDLPRPIKITPCISIIFLLICTFLVFLPLYIRPVEVEMGLLITACGVPVYLLYISWKEKPTWLVTCLHKLGYYSQKIFLGVKEDKAD